MSDIKINAKIYNLDKPTRSGRIYTKEALTKAFEEPVFVAMNNNHGIPIMTKEGDIIGTAHCSLNYPTIDVNGFINDRFVDILDNVTLTVSGCGYVEYDAETDKQIVIEYKLRELLLASHAYVDCSMEVVTDDDKS